MRFLYFARGRETDCFIFNSLGDKYEIFTCKAVYSGSNRTLVGKVSGNAALILGPSSAYESGVEDQTIFGCIASCFQSPEIH